MEKKELKPYETKLYRVWINIKSRCFVPSTKCYHNYGGRGITICDEWKNDFKSFEKWSKENGYKEGLSIDRIDNSGDYEPNNCRWTTSKEQNRNRRSTKLITINGVSKPMIQWSEEYGINRATFKNRIYHGWPEERLLEPLVPKSSKLTQEKVDEIRRLYVRTTPGVDNEFSTGGLAKKFGVSPKTISKIINRQRWK